VLNNKGTSAQKNAVLANSGFAIWCMNQSKTWEESIAAACESLESGKALASLKKLITN
jgi:anthranilate phosphoribosyltransferase